MQAARPEGAEALSPGHRPGQKLSNTWQYTKLLPLQGDSFAFINTQGGALG